MMCRHCGATIEERASVCTDCGGLVGRHAEFSHGRKLPQRGTGEEPSAVEQAQPVDDGLPIGGPLILLAIHLVLENLAYLAFIVLGSEQVRVPRTASLVLWVHASAVLCVVTTVAFFMRLRLARPLLYLHFGGGLALAVTHQLFGFGSRDVDAGLCGIFWLFYLAAAHRSRRTFVVGLA